uniref:Uncharacterized protein n=1 Tax=Oryza brachyantha TaxID=4533 RepID=J3MCM0_ORYBR
MIHHLGRRILCLLLEPASSPRLGGAPFSLRRFLSIDALPVSPKPFSCSRFSGQKEMDFNYTVVMGERKFVDHFKGRIPGLADAYTSGCSGEASNGAASLLGV